MLLCVRLVTLTQFTYSDLLWKGHQDLYRFQLCVSVSTWLRAKAAGLRCQFSAQLHDSCFVTSTMLLSPFWVSYFFPIFHVDLR